MITHLGAILHKFIYGLFNRSDAREVEHLHNRIREILQHRNVLGESSRNKLIVKIANDVAQTLRISGDEIERVQYFVARLFEYEDLLLLPNIDFEEERTVSEYWELKGELNEQKAFLEKFPLVVDAITQLALDVFQPLELSTQEHQLANEIDGNITIPTSRIDHTGNLGEVVEAIGIAPFNEEIIHLGLMKRMRHRLETNLVIASGGNARDVDSFTRQPKYPTQFDYKKPYDLVSAYLSGTPLFDLFEGQVDFTIPSSARFEHHHIIAGSGHGKTQTLQYLIAKDLKSVERGERTVIVIDSQGDLIRNVSNLKIFAPGQPMHDRIVIIDPTDVEFPVSLNLFDVGLERLNQYSQLDRERLTNSILELYDFVLGSLLDAGMTQKQNVIFRYVTRLMLRIPNATIHTFRELMEPKSEEKFAEHIAKLTGTAKQFFETEFSSREFEQTKKQVLRRLWGILENQTFERMFSHPRSKLDLFSEMNTGKVILINTAKDLLKESGTEIFGRFFIALIAQAAQERATLPANKRMPTFVYIDEAADYFDRNIGIILSQARKYNVGMVLAHQYLGQLEPKLQEAFSANTSIKFAGGVSTRDARALGPQMSADPSLIESQPKGSFASYIRGVTNSALPLRFPFGHMEKMEQTAFGERDDLQNAMRRKYAVHYTKLNGEDLDDASGEDIGKDALMPDVSSEPDLNPNPEGETPANKPDDPDMKDTSASSDW